MDAYQPSELAQEMVGFLDCSCKVFGPMTDDDPILEAYKAALIQGKRDKFTPVLVKVDEILSESMIGRACEDDEDIDMERVRAFRRSLLAQPVRPGSEYIEQLIGERKKEYEEYGEDDHAWAEDVMGEMEGAEPNDRFASYWNYSTQKTDEVILAKIPTANPWEVFAWLPMGGWNECPGEEDMMAAAKSWRERYGAIPACVSHDELEFYVEQPVAGREEAKKLALEQYAFCPDRVEQCEEDGSVGKLADSLTKSSVWYFWWD